MVLCFLTGIAAAICRYRLSWTRKEIIPFVAMVFLSASLFYGFNHVRNKSLAVRVPFSFYQATKEYLSEMKQAQTDRFMVGNLSFTTNDSLITIFIIGEALRADHIQLNGYHRTTMPNMEKREVISLPNIQTPYTYTAGSLPYILTRSDSLSEEPTVSESSFIDCFNQCNYHTAWIGNQNPVVPIRFFVNECDTIFINKPQLSDYSNNIKTDLDLIEPVTNLINQGHALQLAVIQLAGNHWWYNKNLHEDFIEFKPILENKTISPAIKDRMINSYDNVTLLTDFVLEEIIKSLENKKAMLIFLSDHGQSFGEGGKWLHANEMPAEKNPACLFWFSEKYKNDHPQLVENLTKNKNGYFDTAFLFHTILDGSLITSPNLLKSQSLFSDPANH
jgi:glucan phosphoethanolaminetransferase (alkaline phosphatase superfamily)